MLTRVDLGHANLRVDELPEKRAGEGANRVFRRGVDATSRVRLATGNRTNVDNMASVLFLELWERRCT